MITNETPFPEVIQHFPPKLAKVLGEQGSDVQMATVVQLRTIMASWDERGVNVDPISYATMLECVGIHIAALFIVLEKELWKIP